MNVLRNHFMEQVWRETGLHCEQETKRIIYINLRHFGLDFKYQINRVAEEYALCSDNGTQKHRP